MRAVRFCPVWCAVEDDCFLGYCFCQWEEYYDSSVCTDRKELYIDDLCVDETHRGRGIATQLYEHTLDYARSIGCDAVTLNVWQGNGAQKFYEKCGMQPQKTGMEYILC